MSDPNQDVYLPITQQPSQLTNSQTIISTLERILPPSIDSQQTFESKLRFRVLITTPGLSKTSPNENESSSLLNNDTNDDTHLKKLKKTKEKKRLTAREKKNSGLFQIPRYGITYDLMKPANAIWKSYMLNICGLNPTKLSLIEERISHSDLQGCMLTVRRSTQPEYIGKHGIVISETKNMFVIITEENKSLCIQKTSKIFGIDISFLYAKNMEQIEEELKYLNDIHTEDAKELYTETTNRIKKKYFQSQLSSKIPPPPCAEVLLYGDQFNIRPYERVTRKYKLISTIEIGK